MTTFDIKLLAAILMALDHVGVVLFPDILAIRYMGRFSFPLFAWLIGQGEKYTRNFKAYFLRLIICGLVSQPIYSLLFETRQLNILATLSLGLIAIKLDKITHLKGLFAFVFAALGQGLGVSYGAYGVLAITLLAQLNASSVFWWLQWIFLNLLGIFWMNFPSYQILAVLAPIFIIFWRGKQGRKAKWFYLFYPLHLALLWFLNLSF